MTTFTVTSTNLSLVSTINSFVDRVFEADGDTFFTTVSHPSVGIKVPDPESIKKLLIEKAPVVITPTNSEEGLYSVELKSIKKKKPLKTGDIKSGSPTKYTQTLRLSETVIA